MNSRCLIADRVSNCAVGGTLSAFSQPPCFCRSFNLPTLFWVRQSQYHCVKGNGAPWAAYCLLKDLIQEHFQV